MTFKIENNTATSECEIDNCKVTLIIERLDGKDMGKFKQTTLKSHRILSGDKS